MAQLALYTFGVFLRPAEHPSNDGFHRRNDPVLALVDKAPGLIARSGYEGDPGPQSWGTQVYPRFYVEAGDGWCPSTLSVWQDMEHAMAFSYFGLHAEALSHGREWFKKPEWPPYAVWWIADGNTPRWMEAVARHERLHDHGPSPHVFNFKAAFDEKGREVNLDMAKIKQISQSQR
jgi:Domain of unknown function (DUF3291)